MKANHSNQPHDDNESMSAEGTWSDLQAGDRLGQAIRESAESGLPPANPQLRERLAEKLALESPVTYVGRESKPGAAATHPAGRWAIALSLVLVLGLLCWRSYQPDVALVENTAFLPDDTGDAGPRRSHSRPNREQQRTATTEFRSHLQRGGENSVPPTGNLPATQPWGRESFVAPKINIDRSAETQVLNRSEHLSSATHRHTERRLNRPAKGYVGESLFVRLSGEGNVAGENGVLRYRYGLSDHYDVDGRSGEQYDPIVENGFLATQGEQALSTFSIDVDTASYANVRRFLNQGHRPPRDAVRIEELLNYFRYDYPRPAGDVPFSVNMEVATCPWNSRHQLLRIGLKGREVPRQERPVSNLVFLLDVSGSMSSRDKLPLLQRGLRMMIDHLQENDRISIVTYAGNAGLVLEAVSGDQKTGIHSAIENLSPGGSTNGSAGIQLAYDLARSHFVEGGVNRVIWATDGDLNVGVTGDQQLVDLVADRAADGVFLTILGFGTGNLKDGKLEKIADNGNGLYAYIDSLREARKVLVEQMSGSLVTIARDVKLQIEFNPGEVAAYRLIGYENRVLATEDFDNDARDAGEIGAGHTVTALYEMVPVGNPDPGKAARPGLKYQTLTEPERTAIKKTSALAAAHSGELLTLALRYKLPESSESSRLELTLRDTGSAFAAASPDFRFAASVAAFGMLLRDSKHAGDATIAMVEEIAGSSLGSDENGYRAEFLDLVRRLQ